jgi:hypothetical protein
VSCIFHCYKSCKQSKSLCLKTLFSSILSWNDQKKYKNIKIAYLIHCPFSRKTLIKSKQINFYVLLIGSEHEPVVVVRTSNWICQSQNARLKTFYSNWKLFCYHIHKKACKFTETIRLFVCFLPVFSSFLFRSCFISFNIQFLSASL